MNIVFKTAMNGEETCIAENFHIHSSYNPSREAQNFVKQLNVNFNPKYILITEPGLSYCSKFLKERFPKSILTCIRFSNSFDKTNDKWQKIFYVHKNNQNVNSDFNENLSEEIFSFFGDEGLATCFFISWNPSQNPFKEEYDFAWAQIKKAILKSRKVLLTRNFFAKRWIKNSIRLVQNAKNNFTVKKGNFPILICASGPSLKSSIPFIIKNRKKFFLIAVSSALKPLVYNKIIPDFCISTDGGFWAKKHISFATKNLRIPLAISSEGSCYANVLETSDFIPLSYYDGIADEILKICNFNSLKIQRNGTVSGTAALLALDLTKAPIFFCGLDLCTNKSYQHTQPNELEIEDSRFDNKFSTLETRIFNQSIQTSSLQIYKDWFSANNFRENLYRLSDNYKFSNKLGKIKDINWENFETLVEPYNQKKCDIEIQEIFYKKENYELKIKNLITSNINNFSWQKEFVPSQAIIYERSKGTQKENEAKLDLENSLKDFLESLNKLFLGQK